MRPSRVTSGMLTRCLRRVLRLTLRLVDIDAGIAPAERGHDLVGVGARMLGEVVGRHVRAEDLDHRAGLAQGFGHFGHVDRHKIH